MEGQSGRIILLNGASSSGKSTLAGALQQKLSEPFWHYSIDHLIAANILPKTRIDSGEFPWSTLRPQFFDGFHRSVASFVSAGNNLIVEHIIETQHWIENLVRLLEGIDVFFVGLHCPLDELERREKVRGDRRIGEAKVDFETTHTFCEYDIEVESTKDINDNAEAIIRAWSNRETESAFRRMKNRLANEDY